jgi:hypothetical protein
MVIDFITLIKARFQFAKLVKLTNKMQPPNGLPDTYVKHNNMNT